METRTGIRQTAHLLHHLTQTEWLQLHSDYRYAAASMPAPSQEKTWGKSLNGPVSPDVSAGAGPRSASAAQGQLQVFCKPLDSRSSSSSVKWPARWLTPSSSPPLFRGEVTRWPNGGGLAFTPVQALCWAHEAPKTQSQAQRVVFRVLRLN